MYFNYHHSLNESFIANVLKDYGDFRIYINKFEANDKLLDKIPSKDSYRWTNMYIATAYTKDFVSIQKSEKRYCVNCGYLIAIVPEPNT